MKWGLCFLSSHLPQEQGRGMGPAGDTGPLSSYPLGKRSPQTFRVLYQLGFLSVSCKMDHGRSHPGSKCFGKASLNTVQQVSVSKARWGSCSHRMVPGPGTSSPSVTDPLFVTLFPTPILVLRPQPPGCSGRKPLGNDWISIRSWGGARDGISVLLRTGRESRVLSPGDVRTRRRQLPVSQEPSQPAP